MSVHDLLERSLVGALAVAAMGLPAAAQARLDAGPGTIAGTAATSQSRPLGQPAPARAHSGFAWDDAGVGAAGALVAVAAAGLSAAARRRRAHRPAAG